MSREWIVSDEDLGCDGAYFSYTEIIRCEHCIYAEHDTVFNQWWCRGREVVPDGYCNYGEEKEE